MRGASKSFVKILSQSIELIEKEREVSPCAVAVVYYASKQRMKGDTREAEREATNQIS